MNTCTYIHTFIHTYTYQASKLPSKAKLPVAKCAVNEKLHTAINKLVRTGYHHCWIVEDATSKKPLGVLSLTDGMCVCVFVCYMIHAFMYLCMYVYIQMDMTIAGL
jgi:hypothetical protein